MMNVSAFHFQNTYPLRKIAVQHNVYVIFILKWYSAYNVPFQALFNFSPVVSSLLQQEV